MLNISLSILKTNPKFYRFHHISTDEVYDLEKNDPKFSEKTSYNPFTVFNSKASSDHEVDHGQEHMDCLQL